VTVFFISELESERTATERNLKAVGYAGHEQLLFTPNDAHFASLVDFKAPVRQKITAMSYTIIANMGDQISDLDGGFSEKPSSFQTPSTTFPDPRLVRPRPKAQPLSRALHGGHRPAFHGTDPVLPHSTTVKRYCRPCFLPKRAMRSS
jgi:hypothetical protein